MKFKFIRKVSPSNNHKSKEKSSLIDLDGNASEASQEALKEKWVVLFKKVLIISVGFEY